ncbi:MAG: 4Fe-4S dicluster domain-containing protein [Ignavibacteriales bacterium]|nr:4Fe-4S dicluster domain-containing protein [Ignavibacteriales bacterium]
MTLAESAQRGGVVGAGGAGFPAHVKAHSSVEYVLGNGAECEPLLHKDLELMIREPEAVAAGLSLLSKSTGATKRIIGVKKKYEEHLRGLAHAAAKIGAELQWLGDFYPTGDEYVLVYESTGRLIPPQGIPLNVGVVVNNVETLRNLFYASEGIPVITKYVTVAGAVKRPSTFRVPIGISFADLVQAAGGASVAEFAVFVSGIMMGKLMTDLSQPVTKTCAGLVVLPLDHHLVRRKLLPLESMHRIGKSACDQCTYCTEFCPRYLLGYDVQPHKVMRSLSFTVSGEDVWSQFAQLCCACGLCTLYACPEELYPKEACDKSKSGLKAKGMAWQGNRDVELHPMYDGRHVPLKQLMTKMGVHEYDVPAHFAEHPFQPKQVRIPLHQHAGVASLPTVAIGATVRAGDCIGEIPNGKLGARIHASIDGVVTELNGSVVIEQR